MKIRYVVLLLLLGFAGWRSWPLFQSVSEQDKCTFGTDSVELYDRLRKEADAFLEAHDKAYLSGYSLEFASKFANEVLAQLREFAMQRQTPTERWAATHELLRAYDMEFDVNGPRDNEKLKSDRVVMSLRYIVQFPSLNRICLFCYLFPTAAFRMQIRNRGDGVYDQIDGGLAITRLKLKWAPVYYKRFYQICPAVLK